MAGSIGAHEHRGGVLMFATPAVETWISPSGRIGTMALDQDSVALEALRDMMRAQGCVLQNEEAPGAVAAATEGEINSSNQGTVIDTSVTPAAEDREQDLVIVPRSRTVTPEQVDWAEGNLAGLPIRYRTIRKPVDVVPSAEGGVWRNAFTLSVSTDEAGERAFRVGLREDATELDIHQAHNVITHAQAGRFGDGFGWELDGERGGDPRWLFASHTHYPEGMTLGARVLVCDDALCGCAWHDEFDVHEAEVMGSTTPGRRWEVSVTRPLGEPVPWTVDVFIDDFNGSPADVAALMNDLDWCRQACERANKAVTA